MAYGEEQISHDEGWETAKQSLNGKISSALGVEARFSEGDQVRYPIQDDKQYTVINVDNNFWDKVAAKATGYETKGAHYLLQDDHGKKTRVRGSEIEALE